MLDFIILTIAIFVAYWVLKLLLAMAIIAYVRFDYDMVDRAMSVERMKRKK